MRDVAVAADAFCTALWKVLGHGKGKAHVVEECEESDDAVKVEEGRKSDRLLKLRAMPSDLKRRARSI